MFEKNRIEAFSDGVFAIILTILVLELKVPEIDGNSASAFFGALTLLIPKLLSFALSFFVIAIFWVNHHHIFHKIKKVDIKLLWTNNIMLFFACLFPFITAFAGDYPLNPYVIALYPLNMMLTAGTLGILWKHAFVDTNLAPNTLTVEQKRKELRTYKISAFVNFSAAALAFVWVPITLAIMLIMPFLFVIPDVLQNKKN